MRTAQRKSTPRVKGGRVQKKNNWSLTGDYTTVSEALPIVDRRDPGPEYRHVLLRRDIYAFIELLPDWQELSRGLNAIVLAPGSWDYYGCYDSYSDTGIGIISLCAWERELWTRHHIEQYELRRDILTRLGVVCERRRDAVLFKWTEPQARAYQLLHTFLHELGHHHDRMTTRRRAVSARGEPYADMYARKYGELIWDRYLARFGLD